MEGIDLLRNCWLEIDLDNLKHNYNEIKNYVKPGVKLMAVVKANAYGHGIIPCGKVLEESGADILGVGSLQDGIKLRKNGVKLPIVVFASNTVCEVAEYYSKYSLIPTILTFEQAKSISDMGKDKRISIFLKTDTGRGRLGVNAEEMAEFVKKVQELPNISIEGIYSHMADVNWADISSEYPNWQYNRFNKMVQELNNENIGIPFLQLANSSGLVAYPEFQMKGVAPGGNLWGFSALSYREGHPKLLNVLTSWKSKLVYVNEVIGGKFGENNKAKVLEKPKKIGVMVGGLSDGIDHRQGTGGEVLIRGKRVKIASGISIEHSIVDLTDCPDAEIGDEVIILGKQGNEEITLNDLCERWDREPLEFLTSLSPALERVFINKK